jgi:hypothetical protein
VKGEIKNAQITNVSLSMADHGCLTYGLTLELDCRGGVYGGYCIGRAYLGAKEFSASNKGLEAMMRIMDVVGVERWEDLNLRYVRIVNPGFGGVIDTIGNIIEDKWFNQREFFAETGHEMEGD